MVVVGSANHDGIDFVPHFIQQFAVVDEFLCVGEHFRFFIEPHFIDVADGKHIAKLPGVIDIAPPLAAHADAGNVQLLVGRLAQRKLRMPGHPIADDTR
jgi:hypothetical protein